jgi:hypothetical protein
MFFVYFLKNEQNFGEADYFASEMTADRPFFCAWLP